MSIQEAETEEEVEVVEEATTTTAALPANSSSPEVEVAVEEEVKGFINFQKHNMIHFVASQTLRSGSRRPANC